MRRRHAKTRRAICRVTLAIGFLAAMSGCARYRAVPLSDSAVEAALVPPDAGSLKIAAASIHHPLLPVVPIDLEQGLTPDSAAIIAVVANPELRAIRDQRNSAEAALLQAKLLPNPQLSYSYDWITGGNTAGAVNAYGWGLSYDINSLLAHQANVAAAGATNHSVDLSVAWQEWQTAEAAKQAVYDLALLRAQRAVAEEIDTRLVDNFQLLQRAAAAHLKTSIDVSAAATAAGDAHAVALQARRDAEHQRLTLNRLLGEPASADLRLRGGIGMLEKFQLPSARELCSDLGNRRLDLVALRYGYQSQEQSLRAAIINQFPKINLGFDRSSDDTAVHLAGLAVTVDLPIFDRNQGSIAAETATRKRLFDEYTTRVFEARADIASAVADIHAIQTQIVDMRSALPNLEQLVIAYRTAVDRGAGDEISYYALANSLAQKNLDELKLQQQLVDAKVALEIASGRFLPDPVTAPDPATQPSALSRLETAP